MKTRDINLDFVKITACIAVVGLHTLKSDVSLLNSIFYYLCGFAIPVFFMSSGYILVNRQEITWEHTWRKSARILLIVVIWGGMLELAKLIYHVVIQKESVLPQTYLIHTFSGLIQRGTMFHFWYLGALIIVYFFICILFQTGLIKKKYFIWGIAAGISVLLQLLDYLMGICIQKHVIQTFRQWTFIQYFFLGGLMPELMPKVQKIRMELHAGCLALLCCCIPCYQLLLKNRIGDPHAEYFYDDILTILWAVVLFAFIMRLNLSEKVKNSVSVLSPLIMGIYIIHVLVIKVIVHFIVIDSFIVSVIAWITVLLVSAVMSWMLSKLPVLNKLIKL